VQWLAIDELPHILKDVAVYPQFDEALRDAMADETLVGTASYGNYRQFKVETTEQIDIK